MDYQNYITQSQVLKPSVRCQTVAIPVHFVPLHGHLQKKGVRPAVPMTGIKHVKDVRSQRWEARVLPLCHCGPYALCNKCHNAVGNLLVGGMLQNFWQVWQALGSYLQVVSILKEDTFFP